MQFFRQNFSPFLVLFIANRERERENRPFIEPADCGLVKLFFPPWEETRRPVNLEKLFNSRPVVARFIPPKNSQPFNRRGDKRRGIIVGHRDSMVADQPRWKHTARAVILPFHCFSYRNLWLPLFLVVLGPTLESASDRFDELETTFSTIYREYDEYSRFFTVCSRIYRDYGDRSRDGRAFFQGFFEENFYPQTFSWNRYNW